ncbi:hypothetical protein INR49_007005 [Caranx melampygus]|nr:hypothetical protein INR49_007005 [Caranx melampygus]
MLLLKVGVGGLGEGGQHTVGACETAGEESRYRSRVCELLRGSSGFSTDPLSCSEDPSLPPAASWTLPPPVRPACTDLLGSLLFSPLSFSFFFFFFFPQLRFFPLLPTCVMTSSYAHVMDRQATISNRLESPITSNLDNLQAKKNFSVSHLLDLEEAGEMVGTQADESVGEAGRSMLESPG